MRTAVRGRRGTGLSARSLGLIGSACALASLVLSAGAAASPEPFRGHLLRGGSDHLACVVRGSENANPPNRVRFCQGGVEGNPFAPGGLRDQRVVSWDSQLIDADVTLPPEGDGPWPLVVLLHGYPGNKTNMERTNPNDKHGFNNVNLARKGFVVVNYSARGMGASCGPLLAYQGSGYGVEDFAYGDFTCNSRYLTLGHGNWTHLADARYEARDTQTLAGYLVQQGIALPNIGVFGESYGGGQALILSRLKDRIMLSDGLTRRWTADGTDSGTPMRIAGASAAVPWSDLINALMPNGRSLDYRLDDPTTTPIGVKKDGLVDGFYVGGLATANYPPPGCIGPAMGEPTCPDLNRWYLRITRGEPYTDFDIATIAAEIHHYHSAITMPNSVSGPAPTFISNGWTDDLFTPIEGIRFFNQTRAQHADVPIALDLADVGHERAQNKDADVQRVTDDAVAWLERYVKGDNQVPVPSGVKALTHTCPKSAASGGPYTASTFARLANSSVIYNSNARQMVDAYGGRRDLADAIDPHAFYGQTGSGLAPDSCRETTTWQMPGVATYSLPPAPRTGHTMLGSPAIRATIETHGAGGSSAADSDGQLAGRLWDVAPDGNTQVLVAKGVYRLIGNQTGVIDFQLNADGWRFAPGHTPKLELLGRDDAGTAITDIGVGSWRASNNTNFTVTVNALRLILPIRVLRRAPGRLEPIRRDSPVGSLP